jgi:hypothetical protein
MRVVLSWAALCGLLACGRGSGNSEQGDGAVVPSPTLEAGAQDAEAGAGFGLGQVDRAGRPLVGVLLVGPSLQDDYNAAPTFDSPLSRTLQDSLLSRLHALDTIALSDGGPDPVDWPLEGGARDLVTMLAADALLVDVASPCVFADGGFAQSFLDLEREAFLDGSTHTTCGGRTPSDDVVDTMLTLLVTNGRISVAQGVAGPTRAASTRFPYLAGPP